MCHGKVNKCDDAHFITILEPISSCWKIKQMKEQILMIHFNVPR